MDTADGSLLPTRTWVMGPVLRPGERRFGRFVLEELAGRGGMGVVWRARDEVLGETVALKFLPDALTGDPRALADLRSETRQARQLSHPKIVRVHEFHADVTGAAVAMEYVEGRSLAAEIADRGVLAPESILAWLPDLAAALDFAHDEAKLVHRDLKPGNILLPATGGAKLADFGISCRISETATRCTQLLAGGTLAYMSPQQLEGGEPHPADDVYALGALLYELVTGRPPFLGGDLSYQIRKRTPLRPSRLRDSQADPLPTRWDETILACLEKTARRRPATAGEVLQALQGGSARWSRHQQSRHVWPAVGAIATAIGVALVWQGKPASTRVSIVSADSTTMRPLPPLSGPNIVGALARDLVVRLPLSGDLRNYAGERRTPSSGGELNWTEDRFDRPKQALQFTGRQRLELPLGAMFRLGGQDPFSLLAWVRVEEGDGSILSLHSTTETGAMARIHIEDNLLYGQLGKGEFDPLVIKAVPAIVDAKWHHIGMVYDGAFLRLYVDGAVAAEGSFGSAAPPVDGQTLIVGPTTLRPPRGIGREFLRGGMDEVRLYRRAVSSQEVLSLTKSEYVPPPDVATTAFYPWHRASAITTTRGRCWQSGDWRAVVTRELGPNARVADWHDVVAASFKWPRLAAELAGLPRPSAAHLTRRRERSFDGPTTYCVVRMDGVLGNDVVDHDQIAFHTLALITNDSDTTLPVLACAPSADRFRIQSVMMTPVPGPHASVHWQNDGPGAASNARCCLRLPFDFASMGAATGGLVVQLEPREGEPWVVSVEPDGQPGNARLRIDRNSSGIQRHVEFEANPAPHELVVVAWRGHLYAAVLDVGNHVSCGDLAIDSGLFAVDAISAIAVDGPARQISAATADGEWVVWQ